MYDKRNGQSEKNLPQLINFLLRWQLTAFKKNFENGKAILRVFEVENSPGDTFSREI